MINHNQEKKITSLLVKTVVKKKGEEWPLYNFV